MDQSRIRDAQDYKHKCEIMYRSSHMNEDRTRVLLYNNPPPNLNDWAGELSGPDRYMPSWAPDTQSVSTHCYIQSEATNKHSISTHHYRLLLAPEIQYTIPLCYMLSWVPSNTVHKYPLLHATLATYHTVHKYPLLHAALGTYHTVCKYPLLHAALGTQHTVGRYPHSPDT